MAVLAATRLVGAALQLVPRPLLALADAWSSGLARRRWQQRQLRRQLVRNGGPAVPAGPAYQPRPWRD